MTLRDFLFAISVPFLWGIGFVITKPGMEQFPPMLINGLRWSLSGLILVWFFPIPKKYLKSIFLVSIVACTIQYSLTYTGLSIIDASSAVLFVQCEVPFGVLIAYFLFKERPGIKNIFGIIIAFVGLVVLLGAPNLQGKFIGVLLLLSGAFTWSLGVVMVKPISKKIGGFAVAAWISLFCGPMLLLGSFIYCFLNWRNSFLRTTIFKPKYTSP
jgi:O-acetylserine/cysteine efflux transporter